MPSLFRKGDSYLWTFISLKHRKETNDLITEELKLCIMLSFSFVLVLV